MDTYTRFSKNNPFGTQSKMLCHWDSVAEYLGTDNTFPIFMEVNLTNRCNLACKWCICEKHTGTAELPLEAFRKNFLPHFRIMGGKALTFSGGGEPTLHPDFNTMTFRAFSEGFDLGLMTNGYYSPDKTQVIGTCFNWARFSVDTVDPVTYKRWKGVDCIQQVYENILGLKDEAVKVGVNCNINMEHTNDDIDYLIDKFENIVDYIQFRPVLPRYFRSEDGWLNEEVWDYLFWYYGDNPKINLSLDKYQDLAQNNVFDFGVCDGHFFNPVLEANGDICACMYHPGDERFVFGNITKDNFLAIWNSSKRRKAIERIRKLDYSKECQVCCKLTEVNRFLDFARNLDSVPDKNFL